MIRLIFSAALFSVSCTGTAQLVPACEHERSARETAFAPLRIELEALRVEEAKHGGAKDGYPPLQLAQRYLELQDKMEAAHKAHPLTACQGADPKVTLPLENSNAKN